jgi:ATP-dependent phosphoenolpyruvate carboxykinase
MSPVAIARALHLLAPHFFPLWNEKINKAVEPEIFTFTMDLVKPLEANQRYVLELHMGEREYSEYDVDVVVECGWAYMLYLILMYQIC